MSVKTNDLIHVIEQIAPLELQESWDNSGWQINFRREYTEKVLVTLEVTRAVIAEAKEIGARFILTHHPLMFTPTKSIDRRAIGGGYLLDLIGAGIDVYSAHTSFDAATKGINDLLAEIIGLENILPYPAVGATDSLVKTDNPILRIGDYGSPIPLAKVAQRVESALDMAGRLKIVGDLNKPIKTVAVCGGTGGDFVEAMLGLVDLYITADLKHHEAQLAKESGMALIDGGHNGTEKHFNRALAEGIRRSLGDDLEVIETKHSADPWN